MPIPLPNLDDRTFTDLVEEMRARIARYSPEWTNHNISDPGIMLLELFAWLTEATVYQINRVPDYSTMQFLKMVGVTIQAAQPAILKLAVEVADLDDQPWILPRGTRLSTHFIGERRPVTFETMRDITLVRAVPRAIVAARQVTVVMDERLGVSSGTPHQSFSLAESPIVLPSGATPVKPIAIVNEEAWEFRTSLQNSDADDRHFTVKTGLNAVAFGDGVHGKVPPNGAKISVNYRYAPTMGIKLFYSW